MAIKFYNADVSFNLKSKNSFKTWIAGEIRAGSYIPGEINIIFCSDKYLLEINKKYLNKDYYTDIITFNYNRNNYISGELFISIERIKDNAHIYNSDQLTELKRVIIHGILHLMGEDDKTKVLERRIHQLEDNAIKRFPVQG